MNDQSLTRLFSELDGRHFDGRLTAAGCRALAKNPESLHELLTGADGKGIGGFFYPSSPPLIVIDYRPHRLRAGGGARAVLLHEMAHAAVHLARPLRPRDDRHGPRFLHEMVRLYVAGEVCLKTQIADFWPELWSDYLSKVVNR